MMKKPILFAITKMTLILTALSFASAYAQQVQPTVNIYAWTDKTSYEPGESGKLTIIIRNDRKDVDLILYNITIRYPWFAYTGEKWEGNDTITVGETLFKNGGVKTYSRSFTVPSDGRIIVSQTSIINVSQILIRVNVDKSPYHYDDYASIYIKSISYSMSIDDLDKMVTLLTVQVVLTVVCTIILAATIFLSMRRPKVVLGEELEKTE